MRSPLSAVRALCVGLLLFGAAQPALAALSETPGPQSGARFTESLAVVSPAAGFELGAYPTLAGLRAPDAGLQPLTSEQAGALVEELVRFAEAAHAGDEAAVRAAAKDLALIQAQAGERMPAGLAARLARARAKVDATVAGLDEARALRIGVVARRTAERLRGREESAPPGEEAGGKDAALIGLALSGAWREPPRAEAPVPAASAPLLDQNSSPLKVPAFRWLLATHTLMVLADNAFKSFLSLALLQSVADSKPLIGLIGALMMLPWVPLAAYAGRVADRVSKSRMIKTFNFLAIPALGLSALALAAMPLQAALPLLFGTVVLMGAHALFYGTAKESVIKEYVPPAMVAKGVGLLGAAGYGMIIAAFPLGAALLAWLSPSAAVAAIAGVAGLGFLTSLRLPHTDAAHGGASTLLSAMREVRRSAPDVFRTLLGVGYFAFLGALAVTAVPNYGKDLLGLSEVQVSLMQALAGVGIAAGAALSGILSNGRTVLGYVTVGAVGVVASSAVLALGLGGVTGAALAMAALGLSAGFFGVPLHSYLQERSGRDETGRNVGLGNFIFGAAGFLGSGVFALIGVAHLSPATSFTLLAALTSGVAAYLLWRFPADAARALLALATKGVYRVRPRGLENIPRKGGFVLAGNHVSWLDAFWLGSVVPRNVRFLMGRELFTLFGRVLGWMKAILFSADNADEALARGKGELHAGHGLGLFPEKQLTRSGQMLGFDAKAVETLNREHETVPFFIDGWGSLFSYSGGRYFWKRIKQFPYRLTVRFGKPLPPGASVQDVRYAVMDLGEQAMRERLSSKPTLARAFLAAAKTHWSRLALVDSTRAMTYGRTLVATIMLSSALQSRLPAAKHVAVLIPPTAGAGLANLALTAAGKVPVNLNFVTNKDNLQGSLDALNKTIAKGDIDAVITSKKILERFKIPETPNMIFIEDLVKEVSARKAKGLGVLLAARLLPAWALERLFFSKASRDLDDTATILFTTGSTGDPKGVELSHLNLWANVEAVSSLYNLTDKDRVMNSLPLFHAFGLTAGLWMPLLLGLGAVQHPSPLEYKTVGGLIEKFQATIFPMIPSQLPNYMKAVPAEQMKSLRYTIGGAEKLWPEVAKAWARMYGSPVLEGYGATELAPVAAVNVPDAIDGLVEQAGHKEGSVGRPIPGVTIRLVDPDNPDPNKPLPAGQEGLLLVKGPGVMKGYYKDEQRTLEVLKDGWYNTADIFKLDQDGFLFFVDRNDGIAKIKGEKVPRVAVEEALHAAAGRKERTFIVVNVKDDRTGQKLVVLHTKIGEAPEQLRKAMLGSGLRPLFVPDAENFFEVDSLPLVGIGKANYKAARVIAQERLAAQGRK